jgi:DNA-binding PadR family transcriptional regulator
VSTSIFPLLLKLEQEGHVSSEWTSSENNRRAKYYRLTRAGRKQLETEASDWQETAAVMAMFLALGKEPSV